MSETALGLRCPVCGGFTPHGYGHACARPASAVIPGIGAPAWWTSDAAQAKIAFHALSGQLLARWAALFPNYAWTDEQTAIDLMAAEIYALRIEKGKARAKALEDVLLQIRVNVQLDGNLTITESEVLAMIARGGE